ncbi:MAG: M28 family peptidase [Desulfurococcales archaeon]|nr:M28 family peptidase [Desulfurococcales archaeon]
MSEQFIKDLTLASRTVKTIARMTGFHRPFRILKALTDYHRIQGSTGLIDAAEQLEEIVLELAPDIIDTELIVYTGRSGPSWLPLPVRWDVASAVLEVGDRRYTFDQHPTLPAAHSPPTEGWVEGEVREPEDPLDPDSYSDKEAIYLITKHHKAAYRVAAEEGVAGVILAKRNAHPNGFPYLGLFLTAEEAQRYTTPAITVPWSEASHLAGKSVRFRVDADIGGPGRLPVLVAWVGDRNGSGPVILAHMCHPRPGANDNASGASSAVEAFLALAESLDSGVLEQVEDTIRLVLVPEYMGTVLSVEGWLKGKATAVVNLDMVGASSYFGVDSAKIYYPPVTAPEHRLADIMYWVSKLGNLGIGLTRYMYGSDHDVFLAYGVESEIVNQWPDPHYHTDLDDADKIDPVRLWKAAVLAASSAYLYARGVNPPPAAEEVVNGVIAHHVGREDLVAARLAAYYLPLHYDLKPLASPPPWSPPVPEIEELKFRRPMLHGLALWRSDRDLIVEVLRKLEQEDIPRDLFYGEVAFALSRGVPVKALYTLAAAVYGVEKGVRGVELAVDFIVRAGLAG